MESPNLSNGTVIIPSADSNDPSTPRLGQKRKRASVRGPQSPGTDSSSHFDPNLQELPQDQSAHRQTATKRACNECRQQKLRCDIVTEPDHVDCTRCKRLKLECRVDAGFKRVGKRNRNAMMEREIQDLRARLQSSGAELPPSSLTTSTPGGSQRNLTTAELLAQFKPPDPLTALHQGAVGSLIDLKNSTHGQHGAPDKPVRSIGNTHLQHNVVQDLFKRYFEHYHPHIPVLDPKKTPTYYYECSPLLFWAIISVASRRYVDDPTLLTGISNPLSTLIWTTIAQVPQNYHVVKALCLLCTWPLPTKSTSTDPTFILSGIMMQVALQTGLHRPSHVQDFARIRLDLREEDISDRLRTWAACNIVAQTVSTGNGQPPKTIYDFTLTNFLEPNNEIPPELFWRLQIERFCNKVSQKLYNNRDHPIGISSDQERAAWISLLVGEYTRLERGIMQRDSLVEKVYLHAAGLHLRLSAFFDNPDAPNYANDLLELYFATSRFLTTALELTQQAPVTPSTAPPATSTDTGKLPTANGSSASIVTVDHTAPPTAHPTSAAANNPGGHTRSMSTSSGSIGHITSMAALKHVGNYIMQMLLAGGFTLMKLLKSFFVHHIDADYARKLFNTTIRAIRAISVSNNDLPGRLAEVLAQLWRSSNAPRSSLKQTPTIASLGGDPASSGGAMKFHIIADNSLQLRVRCRMSMSLLFDSVWRWREEFQFKNSADHSTALANLDNHTEVDNAASGYASSNEREAREQPAAADTRTMGGLLEAPTNLKDLGTAAAAAASGTGPTLSAALGAESGLENGTGLMSGVSDLSQIPLGSGMLGDSSGVGDLGYEVFDPLTWMLDGDFGEYGLNDSAISGGQQSSFRDPWS